MSTISHYIQVLLIYSLISGSVAADDLAETIAEYSLAPVPELINRERFVADPVIAFSSLSPTGKHLVFSQKNGLQLDLYLMSTTTMQVRSLFNTDRLQSLTWSESGEQLILELDNAIGYVNVASESRPSYMIRLDRERGDYFLRPSQSPDNGALVVTQDQGFYRLEHAHPNGSVEHIFQTRGRILDATSSEQGDRWFLQIMTETKHSIYELWQSELVEIVPCTVTDQCALDYFDDARNLLWLRSSSLSDLSSLLTWSVNERKLEAAHSDPRGIVDVNAAVYQQHKPVIVQYHDTTLSSYAIEPSAQLHLDTLKQKMADSNLAIDVSNGGFWFIQESAATLRDTKFYLYELSRQRLTQVFQDAVPEHQISPSSLSPMIPIQYAASDGTIINAYISLPKGRELSRTPMIVLPHGGPWGRVYSNYSSRLQLFVNRGYIVFVPNFRASTGYGKDFWSSANKDFGNGVVQQDITDGVNYLLAQGIGDPDNLAIVGGSFGGFSVLTGLAFNPDLYKVGVALAPPADMENVLKYVQSLVGFGDFPLDAEKFRQLLVDLDKPDEVESLYAKSPYANLSNITAPLLIIAGADDERVGIDHVKDYSLQLLNNGNTITAVFDEDEGHNFTDRESTAATRYLLEAILSLYLGGESEDLTDTRILDYLVENLKINSNAEFLGWMKNSSSDLIKGD